MKLFTKKDRFFRSRDNFLFLSILAFVFVSSTALSLSKSFNSSILRTDVVRGEEKVFPPLPVLAGTGYYPVLSAQGVMAVDLDSGVNLYEKNADSQLFPASTTKIVTALVSLDAYSLDQVLSVGRGVSVIGQKMGLYAGEKMRVEDILYGLLVYSANDAAETLAQNFEGGRDAFIAAMNVKARELSMTNSSFDNPAGLDAVGQRSTAKDLVRASEVAMRSPEFAKIVGTKQITLSDVSGKSRYNIRNVNELLGTVPGVLGVKTGWTENARENLVTYVERDGHKVIIAVLGSQDRFGETKELIDWIFANYDWREVTPQ